MSSTSKFINLLAIATIATVTAPPGAAAAATSTAAPSTAAPSTAATSTVAGPASGWIGAWSTSPQREAGPAFADQTLRMLVHPTVGGTSLRIRLSNTFGAAQVTFDTVSIARAAASGSPELVDGTARDVRFHGHRSVSIPIGKSVFSDPIGLPVTYGQDLAVDVHVVAGGDAAAITGHDAAQGTQFVASGNQAGRPGSTFTGYLNSWFWLDGVDVRPAPATRGCIVALGDSITDGAYTTWNGNDRWTDVLAARLGARFGVLNQGIGGNQVLTDRTDCCGAGTSISGLAREREDVLAQTGVKYVLIADGINDIGYNATAPGLIDGLATLARRAHAAGIRVIGATITPYGCEVGCFSAEQEANRQAVNAWVRTTRLLDGVADFDAAVRDPAIPSQVLPAFQADHLHPNIAGQAAMANAIDLGLFR